MNFPLVSSPGAIVAMVLVALIVPQVFLTAWFVFAIRSRTVEFVSRSSVRCESSRIPVEVVLCLRGCDETLENFFDALGMQNHENWRLRVIVDSVNDPAWAVANAAISKLTQSGRATWKDAILEPLAERPKTGSLKCASLRQALLTLDPPTQVIAMIDADTVVVRQWLLSLVDECMRPGVGAVSGNRWYEPVHDSLSGTVRTIWNAGAIVQMTAFEIPWGGSLAVRRQAVEACGWTEVIRTTLCEDTSLAAPLKKSGWKYRFLPSLVAIDQDDAVSIGPLTRWIARQLLTARLHHPRWPLVAIHGLSTSIALGASLAMCMGALVTKDWPMCVTVGCAVALYEVVSISLVVMIEEVLRTAVAAGGKKLRPRSAGRLLWRVAMLPVTQGVYAVAVVLAMTSRAIEWRGILYEVKKSAGSFTVKIKE